MSAESFFQTILAEHGENFEVNRSGRTWVARAYHDGGRLAFPPDADIQGGDTIVGAASKDGYKVLSTKSDLMHGKVLRIMATIEPSNLAKSAAAAHNIQIGSMQGSALMVGSQGGQQNITYQTTSIEDKSRVEDILREVASIIDALGLGDDDRQDLQAEKATIEAQLQRREPKRSIIGSSLKSIKGLLGKAVAAASEKATEAAIEHAPELVERIEQLLPSWGG